MERGEFFTYPYLIYRNHAYDTFVCGIKIPETHPFNSKGFNKRDKDIRGTLGFFTWCKSIYPIEYGAAKDGLISNQTNIIVFEGKFIGGVRKRCEKACAQLYAYEHIEDL